MSSEAFAQYESRIVRLEADIKTLLDKLSYVEKLARDALAKAISQQPPFGGGNGNPIILAYTPSGGIPPLTVSGTPPSLTIVVSSALCWIYRAVGSTITYIGQDQVYNPYSSGTGTAIGASSQKVVPVIQDDSGNLWAIGEPCP